MTPISLHHCKLQEVTADDVIFTSTTIIDGRGSVFENASLHVRNGTIQNIYTDNSWNDLTSALVVDASEFLISPGLINAHSHSPMGFFRGLCHGQKNMIENIFYPAESAISPRHTGPLSWSYLVGGLRSGITCFAEKYYYVEGIGRSIERLGIRGVLCEHISDIGSVIPDPATWRRAKRLIENWEFSNRLTPAVYPHAADTVSKDLLKEVGEFAKANSLPLVMHLSQTDGEMERVQKAHGMTPVALADQCGVLYDETLAVHLVSVTDDDIRILKDRGVTAGFCPPAQVMFERLAPIKKFKDANIPTILATDAAASNDGSDIHSDLRMCAVLMRHMGVSEEELSATKLIDMVTLEPARALKLDTKIGSLESGKLADLVFHKIEIDTLPMVQPDYNFVYSFGSRHVQHVMVEGEWVLWEQDPVKVSIDEITESYRAAYTHILDKSNVINHIKSM